MICINSSEDLLPRRTNFRFCYPINLYTPKLFHEILHLPGAKIENMSTFLNRIFEQNILVVGRKNHLLELQRRNRAIL